MTAPSSSVSTALTRWRHNLIDLTRRNPLLLLRPTRSSYLVISHPPVQTIFERLVQAGKNWTFWMPPVDEEDEDDNETPPSALDLERFQPRPNELVCADLGRRRLLRILTNLYRRAHTDYQERGLRILHVACGVLEWCDEENRDTFRSPLVLVPVELTRTGIREPFTLSPVEEDPVVNPALQARLLQDFDFRLPPPPDDWDEKSLTAYLGEVQTAIAGLPGWRVDSTALLTLFSFFKGVMYRDLEENAALVSSHPLLRALAGEAVGDELAGTALPEEQELDSVQPPDKTFHILDADASQRLCLEAVARGHSFVLHGPPGTGKSQTIANLIADCLATGKKVLFVSEKMAALEIVYNRLRAVGLGDFCLELHSHKANKREVVAELQRCLQERRQSDAALAAEDFEKLKQRREHLNRYVQALHQVREPLQQTAWWALGELARCAALPRLPLGLPSTAELTPTWMEEARQAVQRLQQLWHIQEQGTDFPWWGFKIERFNLQLRDEVLGLVDRVRSRLDRLSKVAEEYAVQIGAKGPIPWLLKVGELLETSPSPPAAWLTATDLPQLEKDLERCAAEYQQVGQKRAPLTEHYGEDIWRLPEGTAANVDHAWHSAAPLLAPGDERGAGLLSQQHTLRGWAADTQRRIPGWISEARTLEKWLNVTLPLGEGGQTSARAEGKMDPSPAILRQLLRLANLCMSENAPEKSWVLDAKALEQARELIAKSRPQFAENHRRRGELLKRYKEQFFELDMDYLAERFAGLYSSWLRFFSLQYRRDRRAISRRSLSEAMPPTIRQDVVEAQAIVKDRARLEAERPQRQTILGRYEKEGRDPNFDAAERATRIAAEALELAKELDCASLPDKLVEALSSPSPAAEKIRAAAKRLHDSLSPWLHTIEELKTSLPMDALPGTGAPLEESALSVLNQYAKDLQTTLNQFAHLTDAVLARAPKRPADTVALVADLHQAEKLRAEEAAQETDRPRWTARFGQGFQGVLTDWNALKKVLSWTTHLCELFSDQASGGRQPPENAETQGADAPRSPGVPPPRLVQLAAGGPATVPPSRDLREAQKQFEQALHSLEIRFETPPLWGGKRLTEVPLDALKQRLQALRDRVGELADWNDYHHLTKRFAHLGISAFWESLQREKPPREQMLDIFLKAVLSEWVEAVFQQEPALGEFRRPEHERILTEFRDLDRKLIRLTAQRVTQEADSRRPQAPQAIPGSEIALLMREAHKKTKHLPLRRLFDEMSNLLLQLKPCLLMSPLSVSQFLQPEKIHFDVVVFDEASQICPEDAIGAIYRGRQVVITGDDKQLPPTAFFQQIAQDEDEDEETAEAPPVFESILDACLGAGLRPHMLRWHYRSRHEALIAYSNHRYYDNRLVTFPAARGAQPQLGVQFQHVPDGIYDRGGRRDNPREAQVIADLVFQHYRDHGQQKTLGVIAFSQAQMNAIEDEIEQRLTEHPELEAFFKSDRLEGFFVKNLETVQGDERDVILLSVGYGRDAQGRMSMNFGPLNKDGGQRRLNVAVTRAREKLVVVSSIRCQDIDLKASQAVGVQHLYQYLDYAERGVAALELTQPQGQTDAASPLEADVLNEVRRLGYEAVPQVGCSGYRVDLGVLDPAAPGSFLLGIECDGVTYHSAATARDRDRLRQEVLEGLGWHIHRIWSPDWLYRRTEEIERLRQALEETRRDAGKAHGLQPVGLTSHTLHTAAPPTPPVRQVEIGVPGDNGGKFPGTVPYRLCPLKVGKEFLRAEIHSAGAQKEVGRLLMQLVKAEGPIHLEVAIRRLRQAWKLDRAGDRIRGVIEDAVAAAEKKGQLRRQGEFLWPVPDTKVSVRVPDPKNAESNREIERLAPEELQAGMRLLVSQGGGIGEEALLAQTARLFGFGKLGDAIRQRLSENLEALQQQGVCAARGGAITLLT